MFDSNPAVSMVILNVNKSSIKADCEMYKTVDPKCHLQKACLKYRGMGRLMVGKLRYNDSDLRQQTPSPGVLAESRGHCTKVRVHP